MHVIQSACSVQAYIHVPEHSIVKPLLFNYLINYLVLTHA